MKKKKKNTSKSLTGLQPIEAKFSDETLTTRNYFGEVILIVSLGITNSVH